MNGIPGTGPEKFEGGGCGVADHALINYERSLGKALHSPSLQTITAMW